MAAHNPELARVIARRIRALREERGESQEEVGFRSGMHPTAVGQIERGERVPGADTLVRVAGALEVDPGALIAGIAWKPLSYLDGAFDYGGENGGEG